MSRLPETDDELLVGPVFDDLEEIRGYRLELQESGLMQVLERAKDEFEATVSGTTGHGAPYGFGEIKFGECSLLYALVRKAKPACLVETGVCNGVSTAVILHALHVNGVGRLHSIDLPEFTDTYYREEAFWPGKKGAAVPRGKEPGWVIPDEYRGRWELTIGRSQEQLGPLLERLGTIGFFFHDSEHSYECMSFEYGAAYAYLAPGAVLASDDVRWNSAFSDFAEKHGKPVYMLGKNLAFLMR